MIVTVSASGTAVYIPVSFKINGIININAAGSISPLDNATTTEWSGFWKGHSI